MWYDRYSVEGRTVFLTGAAAGIGNAFLHAFLDAGASVYGTTRRIHTDWKGLDQKYKNSFHPVICNLEDHEKLKTLVLKIDDTQPIDILINNASECPHEPNDFYSMQLLRTIMNVTLEAPYLLCSMLAPRMAERGKGSIINITTMNAEQAWPGNPSYISAKSALRMFTKAVARDFGIKGVRANNLCPGYVPTRLNATSYADPIMNEERRSRTMLNRWATPEDMVGACLFLASDASSYITGEDIHVEGGWLAKGM